MITITIQEKEGKITIAPFPNNSTNYERVVTQYILKVAVEKYAKDKDVGLQMATLGSLTREYGKE